MTNKRYPYLCGGVLFTLMTQARKPSISSKDKLNGLSSRNSAPKMMADYIIALRADDTYKNISPTSKVVSRYTNCLENTTKGLPFAESIFISCYDDLVRSQYGKAMKKMSEFVLLHLDPNYFKRLVEAILYIIEKDSEIKDADQFFISPDGDPKTKAEIMHMDQFCLPAVLVGVMHYILMNRGNNNKGGKKTLEQWGTKDVDYVQRKYDIPSHIHFDRKIEVILEFPQLPAELPAQESETIEGKPTDEEPANQECTSNKIYDKIVSMEGKILGRLQSPPPKSPIVSIRLTKPEYITTARNQDVQLYEHFKADIKDTLAYMIQHDPSVDPIERSLPTTLADLNVQWNHMLCMFEDDIMRGGVSRILDLLDMYGYYLSDEYMRIDEVNNFLVCRNQSLEEKYKCNKILAPNIYDIRYALKRQYNKLYNANDDEDFVSSD